MKGCMMARDKGNKVFHEVMKGSRDRTPSPAERRRDEESAKRVENERKRLAAETKRIAAETDRIRRSDIAHARAEGDRRNQRK